MSPTFEDSCDEHHGEQQTQLPVISLSHRVLYGEYSTAQSIVDARNARRESARSEHRSVVEISPGRIVARTNSRTSQLRRIPALFPPFDLRLTAEKSRARAFNRRTRNRGRKRFLCLRARDATRELHGQ